MVAVNGSSVFLTTLMYMMNQSIIQEENSYNYYFMQIGRETNATKCYGMYGCFQLSPPWTSENRPVSLFPDDLKKIEPNYMLYTRRHRLKPSYFNLNDFNYVEASGIEPTKPIYLISHGYMEGGNIQWIEPNYMLYTRRHRLKPSYFNLNDFNYVEASGIEPTKPIYLISHGYMEGGNIQWIYNVAQELLKIDDCSVIVIDWHGGSSPPYTQAVANIRLIGSMTAHLIYDIAQYTGDLKLDHVHCIGHSLGAHLCGYTGYTLQEFDLTLGRITGLDPAEPHFAKANRPVRLDKSAAQYVDVVHTDASQFIRGGLGMTESIGHVDYYPNGGSNQPGCDKSVVQFIKEEKGSFFNGMKKYLGCNHVRSHQLFLDSINTKCTYLTISCSSYEDFTSGNCWDCGRKGEKCIKFGFHGRKHFEKLHGQKTKHASMVQYLLTHNKSPFCRAHYRITVQVSSAEVSRRHGGEIGQLFFTMHSTSDGTGAKTDPVGFVSGYYEPGAYFVSVVATNELKILKAVEIEWKYNSSLFNPLTWRLLTTPKIFLKKVTVESLELQERLTVCPKEHNPLLNGAPQLLIPSYC